MGVRFVHAADLHLGSPLQAVGVESPRLQTKLREATYDAFERVVDLALAERVDFLVLAGDLYDQENRSVRANEFLADQLRRLDEADVPAYVVYGNHDPLGGATEYVELPDNVHEFGHREAEEVRYPPEGEPRARIWGQSYRSEREPRKMYRSFAPEDARIPNVGILHTGLDPTSETYVPCSRADLAGVDDVHYWALGHVHRTRHLGEDPCIVYPGVPQGRHVGEPGPGGCVLAEVDATGTADVEFVPTGPIVWRQPDVSIDGDGDDRVETLDDVHGRIDDVAAGLRDDGAVAEESVPMPVRDAGWRPDGYVCRWHLNGRGPAHEALSADEDAPKRLESRLRDRASPESPFVWTESVVDRTGPPIPDVAELRDDDRVVAEFLALADELEGDDEAREAMRNATDYDNSKNVWEAVDDPEDVPDDRLALTEEKLSELIERAERRVLDELARRRGN